jgi:hypothetical protein
VLNFLARFNILQHKHIVEWHDAPFRLQHQDLYVTTGGFLRTGSNSSALHPQLYQYQNNSNFSLVSTIQPYMTGSAGYYMSTLNAINYAGTMYFLNYDNLSNGSITRFQQTL